MLRQSVTNFGKVSNCAILNAKSLQPSGKLCRNLWGYVAIAFNRVDADRKKLVGPNRLCTEWLLKNGGGIRMTDNPNVLWKDYNSLPPESRRFNIKVADGSNSSVMKIGLDHFAGCDQIDTVIFHNCKYLEEDSLDGLLHLKNSLVNLQVSACDDLRDKDLKVITNLTNLRSLTLYDMINVKDMEKVITEIKKEIPDCQIKSNK